MTNIITGLLIMIAAVTAYVIFIKSESKRG
jgi:hypothetical protein